MTIAKPARAETQLTPSVHNSTARASTLHARHGVGRDGRTGVANPPHETPGVEFPPAILGAYVRLAVYARRRRRERALAALRWAGVCGAAVVCAVVILLVLG